MDDNGSRPAIAPAAEAMPWTPARLREWGMVPLKAIALNVGVGPEGQIVQQRHFASPNKKIWLEPGKLVRITMGNNTFEAPIPPLGWEYEVAAS